MEDPIDALERRGDVVVAAEVADHQLRRGVEVLRRPAGRMGERVEVVEDPHLLPAGEQRVDEMGADEAGAAGDEDAAHQIVSSRT